MSSAPGSTATASSPSAEPSRGRHRGSLLVCALVLAYVSLHPFHPLRLPGGDAFALFLRPKYYATFDILLNAAAYVPLGALACLVFRAGGDAGRAIWKAAAAGGAFSLAMETAQLFVPFRVASIADIAANAAGALMGALLFAGPLYAAATRPLGELRERLFVRGPWGDAGLALLALWIIAQLNPALPFFEAGSIGAGGEADPSEVEWPLLLLQVIAVALSTAGFGMFVSVLLNGPWGALRFTVALLSIALWLKFAAAATMLKPTFTADWVNEVRVIGLAAGLLLFIPLRNVPRRARTYLAILLVLAGTLFAKVVGDYTPLDDLVRLFNWTHGQLTTFASLTRYLHEVWPLLALAYLIALFVSSRSDPVR
jgi:VanZ family protein